MIPDPFEVEEKVERFRATAKEAGIKLTHQRIEIFREVASSKDHPDADAVFRAVKERMPTVSLDTVYRTLWTLERLGLIAILGPRRDSVRFDANLKHHHHYICVRCGLIRDFESDPWNTLAVPDAAREFGTVLGTHVEVRGLCSECSRNGAGAKGHRRRGRTDNKNGMQK